MTSVGNSDTFVAKLDRLTGQFLWVHQFGGIGNEISYGHAVDANGDVIMTGGSGADVSVGDSPELFVSKLQALDGMPIWTRTISGSMTGSLSSVAIDATGNTYAGGRFKGTANFPTGTLTSSAYKTGGFSSTDGLIAKLDTDGNWLWARSLAGDTATLVVDLRVGPDQQPDVSGWFEGNASFGSSAGPIELVSAGSTDYFVSRVDANSGYASWAQRLGTTGADARGGDLAFDRQGNLNIAGVLRGTATFGQQVLSNDVQIESTFVSSLSTSGDFLEAHRVVTGAKSGGTYTVVNAEGLHFDMMNNAYVAGLFNANNFTPDAVLLTPQQTLSGTMGIYIVKLPPAASTKFYVVDDSAKDRTYQYASSGELTIDNFLMNTGNTAPRGAASNAAGTTVWVADKNRNVYVYNNSGALQGSWTSSSLSSTAVVVGVATNGTDVWIVDNKTDKVFKHTGAASRTSGSQSAASSFSLNSANTNPKGIVTDGTSIWVLNDSTADKIFKYTVSGSFLGSWTIDSANTSPTGLTIDPTNGSQDIWVVDNGTDKIYQYANSRSRTSGSQLAAATYALAVRNTNPQGIADPPPVSSMLANSNTGVAREDNRMADAGVLGFGPIPMPSFSIPSSNDGSTSLPRVQTTVRSTDDFMSTLGRLSQMPQAAAAMAWTSPVVSKDSVDPSESDEFETADEVVNDLIGIVLCDS